MPPPNQPGPTKTLEEVVEEIGLYPREAFEFIQRGLTYTVEKLHGDVTDKKASRHVTGQQLCEGLREFSLQQWGLMARTVLQRWNITRTEDFGRIIFAYVDNGLMMKTEDDTPEDFKSVYDFKTAFDMGYRIGAAS